MIKRTKIILLTIFFLTTLIFSQITLSQEPIIKLQVLIGASGVQRWQPFIAQFQQENPNIRIEITEGPNATDALEDLYTASFLLGNSPYDLVDMDIVWVPKFAAAGWLLPLDSSLSEVELGQFLPGDVNGGKYKGKLYRMPLRSDGGMLYYRQDLLEAGGYEPPETFTQLLEIAKALQTEEVPWGYVWQGKQSESLAAMFVEILQGHGAFWVDSETLEVGLDRPEAIAAVKFLRQTINEGISPPGVTTYQEEETRLLFQNGKAVFLRNWPYVFSLASDDNSPIKGKFAIKPMPSLPGQPSGACQGGWGLGIAASSKHPDAAWKLIEFITREEIQRQFVLNYTDVPSRISLFNDPEIVAKYQHYPQLLKVVQSSALRPPIPQYAQASDILQRYLSAALTERMSPEKAMEVAANETRRLLGQLTMSNQQ